MPTSLHLLLFLNENGKDSTSHFETSAHQLSLALFQGYPYFRNKRLPKGNYKIFARNFSQHKDYFDEILYSG